MCTASVQAASSSRPSMVGGVDVRGGRTDGRPFRMPAPDATPNRGASSSSAMKPGATPPATTSGSGRTTGTGSRAGAGAGSMIGSRLSSGSGMVGGSTDSGGATAAPNAPPRRRGAGRAGAGGSAAAAPEDVCAAGATVGSPRTFRSTNCACNASTTRSWSVNRSSSEPSILAVRRTTPVCASAIRAVTRNCRPSRWNPPVTSQATSVTGSSASACGERTTTVRAGTASRPAITVSARPSPSAASAGSRERFTNGTTVTVPGRGRGAATRGAFSS